MPLIDMKRKAKKSTGDEPVAISHEEGGYPWGLRLSLEKEELSKLGVKGRDFTIGETINLTVQAEVTSLRESANKTNDESSIELQITKIALEGKKDKKPDKFGEFQKQHKKGPGE